MADLFTLESRVCRQLLFSYFHEIASHIQTESKDATPFTSRSYDALGKKALARGYPEKTASAP